MSEPQSVAVRPTTVRTVSGRKDFQPDWPTDHPDDVVTVRDVLQLDSVAPGAPEVLAGHAGLGRALRWVHAGEMITVADSLVGGELLLTTGLAVPADEKGRTRLVDELAGRDVAAICIELGSVWTEPPADLLASCDRRGVPLVVFRKPVLFVTITEQVHTLLINRRYAKMRVVQSHEDELLLALMSGATVYDVLLALADMLNDPVGIVGPDGRPTLAANPERLGRDALEDWPDLRAAGAPLHVSAPLPATGQVRAGSSLVAVMHGAVLPAYAGLLIERATRHVAMSAPVPASSRDRSQRDRADLLRSLITGEIPVPRLVRRLADVDFRTECRVTLGFAADSTDSSYIAPDEWASLATVVQQQASRELRWPIIVSHCAEGGIHGALALDNPSERASAAASLARIVHRCAADVVTTRPLLVVGRSTGLEHLGAELSHVAQCVASRRGHDVARDWVDVTTVELSRLLWTLRGSADAADYARRVLAPFHGVDAARNRQLLETVRAYCANLGQKTETARTLHINRQSLYARITRIEELTGLAMDEPETVRTFELALRLADLQDE